MTDSANDAATATVLQSLAAKLQGSRPVRLTADEEALFVEALREAIATTLSLPPREVADDARLFDTLGLDSIDVFDALDQLSQRFEVPMALEELPETLLRSDRETTFRAFADGLLGYFRQEPAAKGG
jgi:acyl carrier protein